MEILIRNEEKRDYRRVEEVAREAFWNLYIPGCVEHYTIHCLRESKAFIPELTFVIEVDGQVVGSIFYSYSSITDGIDTYQTITFGPVSILPSYHRKGLGRRLIEHSIDMARKKGHRAIVTLGYPYHYEPYGFLGGKSYGISMDDGLFYKGLLVLPLYQGALDHVSGKVHFADELETDESEAFEYDKNFPFKKKEVKKSQKAYEIACQMIDD